MKLHYHQLERWFVDSGRELRAFVPITRVIRVTRRDRLGQAISWVRARQTGRYAAHQRAWRPPRYRRDAIDRALHAIEHAEAGWDRFLAQHGDLPVLRVAYEELAADLEGTVHEALAFLGASAEPLPPVSPSLRAQADATSERWRARYEAGR